MHAYRYVGPHADHLQRRQNLFGDGMAGRVDGRARKVRRTGAAAASLCAVLHAHAHAGSAVHCAGAGRCAVRRAQQVSKFMSVISLCILNRLNLIANPHLRHFNLFFSYYEWLRQQFAHKRKILEEGLLAAGIEPMASSGGFFLMGQLPVLPHLVQDNIRGM